MVRVLFLTFIYLLSVGAAKLCQNETNGTSLSLYFSGIADLILHGYGYRTLAGISVIRCGNLCLSDTRCSSINYSERDKVCELNGATASQYPPAMVEWNDSYYYGPEEPMFMRQLKLIRTHTRATPRRTDSHHSASSECQKANQHLCQPWEIHQVYETGYYRDIHVPIATSFWYSVPDSKILVNATGLTYLSQRIDTDPIITSQNYHQADRVGQAQACSALDAHPCTLAELKEAYLRGYRQPYSQWLYFSVPERDAQLYNDGCCGYSGDECYEGIVANTPRPRYSCPVFCCPTLSEKVSSPERSSPAMCCPGLIIPRDPIITEEVYAKEDRDVMASACSALQSHLCTLAELKEAYMQGYRQPHSHEHNCEEIWHYFAEPNQDAILFNDGCGLYTGNVDECYEDIVAHTPRPYNNGRVFCCPRLL
ncbi:uncharacterized protein LOC117288844 [Asterias rubens]|uniref:uncharacterized protein LOC117288844 n=1 Tax=Asterias rubens TaxID=7604 RepID=UPI0014550517|nr:uncharacterized protein LOC117288844 [Asterias rubens]